MILNSNRSINLHVYLCSMLSILLFFNIHIQGRTPLHIASLSEKHKTVELLLLLGADMDIVDTQVLCYMYKLFIQ
jgi:ankyrin repeat protein